MSLLGDPFGKKRELRKGTNGVSTNGVTDFVCFSTEGQTRELATNHVRVLLYIYIYIHINNMFNNNDDNNTNNDY